MTMMNAELRRPKCICPLVLLAACLISCAGGGTTASRTAQSAVIVPVDWVEVSKVLKANYYNQRGVMQFLAVLETGEEARAEVSIAFQQACQLKDGGVLLVKSKDGKYHETFMTIIP